MAESLSGFQLAAQIVCSLTNTIDAGASNPTVQVGFSWARPTLTSGTGANMADKAWHDTLRLLTSGTSENLDLYDLAAFDIGGGAGKSALGQSFTNVELCGIIIGNNSTSVGNLLIGGEGSAASFQSFFHVSGTASDTAGFGPLKPGGVWMTANFTDPAWAIVDAANHLLKIAATGGDVSYNAMCLFRSA